MIALVVMSKLMDNERDDFFCNPMREEVLAQTKDVVVHRWDTQPAHLPKAGPEAVRRTDVAQIQAASEQLLG